MVLYFLTRFILVITAIVARNFVCFSIDFACLFLTKTVFSILDQDKQICSWLRNRITNCKTGLKLEVLHDFITTNYTVNLQGRCLTAHDTLSYVRAILPRAVPDFEETDDHQMYVYIQFCLQLSIAPLIIHFKGKTY